MTLTLMLTLALTFDVNFDVNCDIDFDVNFDLPQKLASDSNVKQDTDFKCHVTFSFMSRSRGKDSFSKKRNQLSGSMNERGYPPGQEF